jgi:hypothetical protein
MRAYVAKSAFDATRPHAPPPTAAACNLI